MTAAQPKLTKSQFVARVNRFCRHAWKLVLDNFDKYSGWQSKKLSERKVFAMTTRLTLMAGIDFHIFDNIRFLGSPPGEEVATERIIGPMQEAVERGQRLDPLYSVEEIVALFAEYNRRALRYGLRDCPVDASHIGPIEGYVYTDRGSSSS